MADDIVEQVRSKYAAVAGSGLSGDLAGVRAVAEAFGYTPEELASIPADANLGLSCGTSTKQQARHSSNFSWNGFVAWARR